MLLKFSFFVAFKCVRFFLVCDIYSCLFLLWKLVLFSYMARGYHFLTPCFPIDISASSCTGNASFAWNDILAQFKRGRTGLFSFFLVVLCAFFWRCNVRDFANLMSLKCWYRKDGSISCKLVFSI